MVYKCNLCNEKATNDGLRGVGIIEGSSIPKWVCTGCIGILKHREPQTLYPDSDSIIDVLHGTDKRGL